MNFAWTPQAWEEYQSLLKDKQRLKKVNNLIKALQRNSLESIGRPEKLKGNLSGFSSVRIDKKNRLVYKVEKDTLIIIQCKTHYSDK